MTERSPKPVSLPDQITAARQAETVRTEAEKIASEYEPLLRTEIYSLFSQYIPKDPNIKSNEELSNMSQNERVGWIMKQAKDRFNPLNSHLSFEIPFFEDQDSVEVHIQTNIQKRLSRYRTGGLSINFEELDHTVQLTGNGVKLVSKEWISEPGARIVVGGTMKGHPAWRRTPTKEQLEGYLTLLQSVPTDATNIHGWRSEY